MSKAANKVATVATKVAQKADAITKMSTDQIVSSVKSVATSVVKTVASTVKSAVNTVVSCTKKVANAVSTFYNEHSELIHTALDVVGMIPCLGDVCDAVNAGLYLLEGDYANAAMSAISFIPMAGALAAVGKIAGKYGDNLVRGVLKYGDDVAEGISKYGDDIADVVVSNGDDVIESVMECTDGIGRAVTDHVDEAVENVGECLDGIHCFVAGTLILTVNGLVPIEEIKAGDTVIATNEETGETTEKEVVRVFVNEAIELAHVWVNGEEIISTPGHKFYVPEKGWTSAINLRAGDILVLSNGEYVTVEKVEHELLETPVTIYNFEVEDFHTYYVGEQSVLVHNDGCPEFYGEADFVVDSNGIVTPVSNIDTSPVIDQRTGHEVGRFVADDRGNVLIEPVGGDTVEAGRGGVDTHTLYPNGSNYQRYNPVGHGSNTTPHGHGHAPGTGGGIRGQGASLDVAGNVVPFNSDAAHWPIN